MVPDPGVGVYLGHAHADMRGGSGPASHCLPLMVNVAHYVGVETKQYMRARKIEAG